MRSAIWQCNRMPGWLWEPSASTIQRQSSTRLLWSAQLGNGTDATAKSTSCLSGSTYPFDRSSHVPLSAGDTKLGVFICYESIFPNEIRQLVAQGAQVLVNISNDGWYGDSGALAQHLNQARMRAVENHRWLLRDTNTGLTASIDPYGRVVAHLERQTRAALAAPYALTNVTTFYSQHGDWFAYLCAIISIGALIERFAFHPKAES